MPRILSIATLYPNAHAPRFGTFVARQLEALAARDGWDMTVINPIGVPPVAAGRYKSLAEAAVDGVEGGVAVHRPRFTLIPKFGARLNPALIARSVLPIARRLHAERPFDLVDAQFFYPDGPAAARIARQLDLPLSIKARGADISHWGAQEFSADKMRQAADQAAGLLSVSMALARDMAKIGLPQDKITVHYTGLDRTLFKPLDKAECRQKLAAGFGIAEGGRLLATVGALIPRKGQRFVIEALEQLADTQLILVGKGEDERALRQLAGDAGDRVHFLGSLDHKLLPVVLSAADAMVLPSASEGLANAWVEALACGTPLVITDAGGAKELVQNDTAGRIVDRTADAIAAGVTEVLTANYAAECVASNAAQFSWEANAAALANYYSSLIAQAQVSPRAFRS
ncbi:glycosyltransferase [Aurantiacibacter marinus]|uniref:Glycoside hydrolase n=1 Tax=Aurantiacibacter marinus TaxID=874156 RepID=A0A0H0XMA4_9SPHN|nr:glycosyltransferase [Aurantiacibacter marinus]KLI63151.1 glycoside hydrolase [Aurantiacibacter marinus]